jgi:hypothetical protein
MNIPNRPLSRREASHYLYERHGVRRSYATLSKLAVTGGGPRFHKANRVPLYDVADLDEWVEEICSASVRSTSELRVVPHRT